MNTHAANTPADSPKERARCRWTWKNVHLSRRDEDRIGREFQVEFFKAHLERDPRDVDALMELGNLYTLTGRICEGLDVDKRLVELRPDEPIFQYNLACSHCLLDDPDAAIAALDRAVDLGYDNLEYLQEDSDLARLRSDERFKRIVERLRRMERSSTKPKTEA